MPLHPRNLTWSAAHRQGTNSLAQAFPSFQLNTQNARQGSVKVEARAPSGKIHDMGVSDSSGVYTANFTPTEVGEYLCEPHPVQVLLPLRVLSTGEAISYVSTGFDVRRGLSNSLFLPHDYLKT